MQIAHQVGARRQFILADDERSGHGAVDYDRSVLVQEQCPVAHGGGAGIGIGISAGKGERAATEFCETAGAGDLAIEKQ